MKYIKNSFLFFIFFLPIFAIKGNFFTSFFNKYAFLSLFRSLSLRYQIFFKKAELKKLEQSYKKNFKNALKKTEYPNLDKKSYQIFTKNYIIQKELGGQSIRHILSKLFYGTEFMQKQQKDLALYNTLCNQRHKVFIETYKNVYTQNYYHTKRDLAGSIRLLNEQIPLKWLQKLTE